MIMYFDVDDCLRMATRAVRPCSSLWAFDLFSADQWLFQILKTEIDRFKYVYHHDHFCLIVMMMRMIILAGLMPGAVFIYCWSLQIWLLYDYSIHRGQWRGGPYQCPLKGTKRSQKNISMITSYCSLLPIPPPKRDVRVSEKPPFSLQHKNTNRSNETRTKKNAQLQIDGICTLWIIFYSKGFCAPKEPAEIPIAPCETKMVSTAPSKRTMIRIKLISMINTCVLKGS